MYATLSNTYPRMADVLESIDWRLGALPQSGDVLTKNFRIFRTSSFGTTPAFWVLYKYIEKEHQVHLIAIKLIPGHESE